MNGDNTAPSVSGSDRFSGFDGLRAIAALGIVVYHAAFLTDRDVSGWGREYLARLDIGVSIFFVVSGFLLYRPFLVAELTGESPVNLRRYFSRRMWRIFPAYWLTLSLVWAFGTVKAPMDSFRNVMAQYLLVHIYDPDAYFGALSQSWTLAVEISFYLLLPGWAFLMRRSARGRSRLTTELFGLGVLYLAGLGFRYWLYSSGDLQLTAMGRHWIPASFDMFAIGMALGVVHCRVGNRTAPVLARTSVLWILGALICFWGASTQIGLPLGRLIGPSAGEEVLREVLFGAAALCLMVPVVFGSTNDGLFHRLLGSRVMAGIGAISYGIYLWHNAIMASVADALGFVQVPNSWVQRGPLGLLIIAVACVSVVMGSASYLLVERPILRWNRRRNGALLIRDRMIGGGE